MLVKQTSRSHARLPFLPGSPHSHMHPPVRHDEREIVLEAFSSLPEQGQRIDTLYERLLLAQWHSRPLRGMEIERPQEKL